ncbi:transcriptional repressor, partial [Paraburkholderia sp. SIMBA_049]
MKGTERVRGTEFGLHAREIRYILAILRFSCLLHAMATSSPIDARLSRADAFAAEH